jgi:aryl-alcohol dehydrogenase-like predicted oxidoreductase
MQVSPLCLGAMMFGAWGEPDHQTSIGIIHRALDAGINFIDTADVYSQGESEVIVGKALAGGRRDGVILATKFHAQMGVSVNAPFGQRGTGDPNKRGNSRRWIVQEVDNSLRRLGTDWIDLYQVHRPDPDTDVEETLSALTDLQRQGKIRAFGSSTFPAHQIVEAQWTAQQRALGRFVTEQPPYSLLVRGIEADVLPVAQRYGMAYRQVPQGPGCADVAAFPTHTRPVRLIHSRQSAQARRRRRLGRACRTGRDVPDSPGSRFRKPAPRRNGTDHRPTHDATPGVAARRRRPHAVH